MKKIVLVVMCCLFLWGCGLNQTEQNQVESRIVVEASIGLAESGSEPLRVYRDEDTIEAVLKYLNDLKLGERAEGEVSTDGGVWEISLRYADGRKKSYYLKTTGFIKEGDEPWVELAETPTLTIREFIQQNDSTGDHPNWLDEENQADDPEATHKMP